MNGLETGTRPVHESQQAGQLQVVEEHGHRGPVAVVAQIEHVVLAEEAHSRDDVLAHLLLQSQQITDIVQQLHDLEWVHLEVGVG